MAATSTYQTYLMHGTGSGSTTYEKLIDIKEFGDLGQTPETLETTTLSDNMVTLIQGIMGNEGIEFTSNYEKESFTALKALEHKTEKYAVWFGAGSNGTPDGSLGKFSFDGQLSVRVTGGGVNQVRNMSISIAPSTPIEFE